MPRSPLVPLFSLLLLPGCFAELAVGPGFVTGGASGVGVSVGVVVGANLDPVSTARVAVAAEFRGNKPHGSGETFSHSTWGLSVLGDVALLKSYRNEALHSLRLRAGASWAPISTLSLVPELTGRTYEPVDLTTAPKPIPHTTWGATAGLAFDAMGGPVFLSIGPDLRVDFMASKWMGDVLFITPQVRLTIGMTSDGFVELMSGVEIGSIKPKPPPGWLKSLPTGPDTSHSDEDRRKANDAARKNQEDSLKQQQRTRSCSEGGPC